jgi:hypothetical protein
MITAIQLFIGLTLTIAAICIYFIWFRPKDIVILDAIPLTLFFMPLVSVFAGFIIFFNIRFIDSTERVAYKPLCNIVSIRNNDVTSGNFTLGCGRIEETEYYFYFYKTLNGGYARGKKSVNKTEIVENNAHIPQIKILTTSYKSKSGLFKFDEQKEEKYIIVVPKGTILNKFQLY